MCPQPRLRSRRQIFCQTSQLRTTPSPHLAKVTWLPASFSDILRIHFPPCSARESTTVKTAHGIFPCRDRGFPFSTLSSGFVI